MVPNPEILSERLSVFHKHEFTNSSTAVEAARQKQQHPGSCGWSAFVKVTGVSPGWRGAGHPHPQAGPWPQPRGPTEPPGILCALNGTSACFPREQSFSQCGAFMMWF